MTAEFFSNATNTAIYGSSFGAVHNTIHSTARSARVDGFQILLEHVAASAFHNSKQRRDPPRCHEHTREAVLDEIFEWIDGDVARETWIAWLNGAAGAGKTAICQSIAERCILHGILVASFFFFRADSSRNTIDPLVATLAYQIIQLIPETKKHIVEAIQINPLIFEQVFEAQLEQLVVSPLRLLRLSGSIRNILLIIDGVDECDGQDTQMNLIRTIAKLLRGKNLPLVVLFGSRRENQLLMAFNSRNMTGILNQLPLDDVYKSEEDIRHFLDESFDEIKQTHLFSKRLADGWPSPEHVQEIIDKSSCQFIYASLVIKFLFSPSTNPSMSLDIVRGTRPTGRLTPFAELDALYRRIFLQVDDLSITLEFLAYLIFGNTQSLKITSYFFECEYADVESLFVPLTSIILCDAEAGDITFHHATSLPDFLRDQSRSRDHCINAFANPLSIRWFQTAASGRFRDLSYGEQNEDILHLLQHAEPTAALYESLISYTPSQHRSAYESEHFAGNFLTAINNMDFGDDRKVYNDLLDLIVRYVNREFPENLSSIAQDHDVSQIMAQLAAEKEADLASRPIFDIFGLDNTASASSTETPGSLPLPSSFRHVEETPHPLFISQFNDRRKSQFRFRKTSKSADSNEAVDANTPPSTRSQLSLMFPAKKRDWGSKIKIWLSKWSRSRTKT